MKTQRTISSDFPYESRYITVQGFKIHYVESGTRDPPILLLHGIPTHSYLWRNVIPHLSPYARTVAIDLIGFGRSDKPTHINYDLSLYSSFIEDVIRILDLKQVTIVCLDLGLILGLNYAMNHEENVRSLVLFEGFFQPMERAYKNLPLFNRFSLRLMKVRRIAEHMIVDDGEKMVERMISMATIRRLTKEEISQYQTAFSDKEVRKRVWLEGIGPSKIGPRSTKKGDLVDQINTYSERLSHSQIPKLLLYGDPGMAVTRKTVESAKREIPNLITRAVGRGKHFLPEDQPDAIGEAIAEFYREINDTPDILTKPAE